MPNQIRDYFHLLGVGSLSPDPTIPFDNEFHLLGLDESESDQQIAQKAKVEADSRSHKVDRIGVAHTGKRLDILLRDKINQAGMRFDGQAARVAEHREELHRLRERRVKDFAKDLCDSGKWTAKEGTDMLETVASTIGVAPNRLQKAVVDAVQSAGQWTPPPPPPPLPQPVVPVLTGDVVSVGSLTIPLWVLILPIGLALGLINGWAGFAFGLSFLILAWGKANAERKLGGATPSRSLRWGVINAVATCLLLLRLPGPAADGPEAKWAGEWDTDWGKMTFAVKSSRVTAQYESRTGEGQADLKATNERQLDGSWCRGSCAPPNDAGRLRLILDESGQAFEGWYTNGDSEISNDPAYQVNGRRKAQQ